MRVEQVGPHSHYVQGLTQLGSTRNQNFISNAGFVITPAGVVVVDALGSPRLAERLTQAIRQLTDRPITHVIVTHYHADHIYGLQHFKQLGAQIVAHRASREYIQSDTARLRLEASRTDLAPWIDDQTRIVPADLWLDGATSLKVGGVVFELTPVGPSHTPEDLTVYVPSEKVLFAGDLFFHGRLPFVGQANSRQWVLSLDRLLAFDAKAVVPGHGAVSTDPKKDIGTTRDYLKHLRQSMGDAVENFVPFDEAYDKTDWSAFAAMPMFGPANRMNAYNTYLLLEQEALGKK
ncbi:MAG: MBL fold metallo-hydrolase [Hydrogenophaga sp.]|jgi:glyoxylase-like metal-dependent hydrolase (beta-lactamase superfamily II)|nr:MBL fold metallo-hydrolase [Hydrogenophaga sp.]MBW0169623.1 MBL fold metallo-hydrolase [Hydrogenophaga sp.]MBW0182566.1 MBL fold metallo-hydrolase [Hydrogenophaga sp.]